MEEQHSGKITPCFARYPGSTSPAARGDWRRWRLARRKRLQSMGLGQPGHSPAWRRKVAAKTSTVHYQSRSAPVWDTNEPSDFSDLSTCLFALHCRLDMHGVADAFEGPRQSGQR